MQKWDDSLRRIFVMAAKKLLMLVGDYVEDYEVMVPFQALFMVGQRFTILRVIRPTVRSEATISL
jgi:hypothetical protein